MHQKFVKTSVDDNNNKYWYVTHEGNTVTTEYGRVGSRPQKMAKTFRSEWDAESFMEKKIREKLNKGYKKVDVIEATMVTSGFSEEAVIEKSAQDDDAARVMRILIRENIHSIVESTTMEYDRTTGLFSTPVGIVSRRSINDARWRLNKLISLYKDTGTSYEVVEYLNEYLMLIPQKTERKLTVEGFLPNNQAMQEQFDLLDKLEASVDQAESMTIPDEPRHEVDLGVRMKLATQATHASIEAMFNKTSQYKHQSYGYAVDKVFDLEAPCMREPFMAYGYKMDNIWKLWHGTKSANVLSILAKGLYVPPSTSAQVTGRMFGDGLYFSDQSTKSLNYATGYWDGGRSNSYVFMLVADVAMGRFYTPRSTLSNPPYGYDSVYAKGGESGVINNEMIVYRTDQVDLVHLVRFKK